MLLAASALLRDVSAGASAWKRMKNIGREIS